MLLLTVAKMRAMLLSTSCPVPHDLVAHRRRVLLVPVMRARFFLPCSLLCRLGGHGLGKCAPRRTDLSAMPLYISKNQHIIGNDTSYDEIE